MYQFLVIFFEKCLTSEEEDQTVGLDMGQRFKEDFCVHTGLPSSLRECNRNPHPGLCLLNSLGIVSKLEFPTQVDTVGEAPRTDDKVTRVRQNGWTRRRDRGIQRVEGLTGKQMRNKVEFTSLCVGM